MIDRLAEPQVKLAIGPPAPAPGPSAASSTSPPPNPALSSTSACLPATPKSNEKPVTTTAAVALTGVTGHVGGLVAGQLSAAGVPLRLLARTPETAAAAVLRVSP
jgi:hypothetical protein